MRKSVILLVVILFCFFICSCFTFDNLNSVNAFGSLNVRELDPVELYGTRGAFLKGKLFLSSYENQNSSAVRNTGITNAAKKANEKGYPYFTIVDERISSITRTRTVSSGYYASRNVYVPPTTQDYIVYIYECIFIVLKANETDDWDNIYSVSSYVW